MSNKPKENNSLESTNGRVNLTVFLGRIIGGFLGLWLGISLGIRMGGSLMPIIMSVVGVFAGVFLAKLIFKTFPQLSTGHTISSVTASYGTIGLIICMTLADVFGAITGSDRLYSTLIGAALGLLIGMLLGMTYKQK